MASPTLIDLIRAFHIYLGAAIRYLYHRTIRRERYSYHAFLGEAPLLDTTTLSYSEAFGQWQRQQPSRIDTDIYPCNPEWFTNRTIDGMVGGVAVGGLILIACLGYRYL